MAKYRVPDLSNATPASLVNEIAKLRTMQNYIKAMEKVHKEALFNLIGGKDALLADDGKLAHTLKWDTEFCLASFDVTSPQRLDVTSLKNTRPEIYEAFLVSRPQITMRTPLKGSHEDVYDWVQSLVKELDLDWTTEGASDSEA